MSHAPEKPPMLSVEASPEQQAQPARCALAAGSAKKRNPLSGQPAIFEGDEWFYVEATKQKGRRLWALFPVRAWADQWVREMAHPENFEVKQLLHP